MPRKDGVGRRHKKSKVTVTEEPTPEVEEQPEEGVEEEEPEDVDEPIDEIDIRAQHATDLLIENLINDFAVDVQDQRLCKYEAVAVACREAWESRISERVVSDWERDTFEEAYEKQRYELSYIYEDSGIPPCDMCGKSRAFCNCSFVGCACGEEHAKFEWSLYPDRTPECTPLVGRIGHREL